MHFNLSESSSNDELPQRLAVEPHGIEYIPEEERYSRPINVVWIMLGSFLTFPGIMLGWIPIALGLSWWAAFWAIIVGTCIGALLLAPMSLLSPQTGTNNPVNSSVQFGIHGRIVGSVLALIIAVLFGAVAVWTAGDAILAVLDRWLDISDTASLRVVIYSPLTLCVGLVAIYGHAVMSTVQKAFAWIATPLAIVGILVFWSDFNVSGGSSDPALGSFWATWVAGAIPAALAPVGYTLAIGDWTRYISPRKYSQGRLFSITLLGAIACLGGPMLWGAYTATTFIDPTANYVSSIISNSPAWYVVALLIFGLGSGVAQGTVNIYSTGLDMSSIFPRIDRIVATITVVTIAYIVVLAGAFAGSLLINLQLAVDFLTVGFVSFISVVIIGFWNHRGQYDAFALQSFSRNERGGRYWFSGGYNWRAIAAFCIGTTIGVLGLYNSWIDGPLAISGMPLGPVYALLVSGAMYVALLIAFPEPDIEYVSGGSRFRRGGKLVQY